MGHQENLQAFNLQGLEELLVIGVHNRNHHPEDEDEE